MAFLLKWKADSCVVTWLQKLQLEESDIMAFRKSEIYVYKNWHHLARFLSCFPHSLKHHLLLYKFSGSYKLLKFPCSILSLKA